MQHVLHKPKQETNQQMNKEQRIQQLLKAAKDGTLWNNVYRKTISTGVKQVGDDGSFSAVFAKFNVIDLDGDVTLPGAFGEQTVKILPRHNRRSLTLGKGVTREDGDDAIVDARLNLAIPAAKDMYESFKFDMNGDYDAIEQFSYGFRIPRGGLSFGQYEGQEVMFIKTAKIIEVSPVVEAAGIDTGLLDVKNRSFLTQDVKEMLRQNARKDAAFLDYLSVM